MLTSPEFWVSLGTLVIAVVAPILAFVLRLSSQLTTATVQFTLVGQQQATELTAIKDTIDQMRAVLAAVAVDRETVRGMDQRNNDRFRNLEQTLLEIRRDINDVRRGRGLITEPSTQ
jgi:hypothetical protein